MYLRDRIIKILKIKNVIFVIVGIFNIAVSSAIIISLISHYSDQLETVLEAKATPDSIRSIIIGIILLILSYISRRMIGDANFYSSYFEGDLDGYIKYSDLAEVTGKNKHIVKIQLYLFRMIYMKGYEQKNVNNSQQIVLKSKKCICECRSCGASIEKRIYFTGVCPYCGNSDLFAKVLTDNRFYSIENNVSSGLKKPSFYSSKNIDTKKILFMLYLILGLLIMTISAIACMDNIAHYNDKDYLTEVLLSGKSYSSFKLIKHEIMDTIIWFSAIFLAFIPVVFNRFRKIKFLRTADDCSVYFSRCNTPFVSIEKLPSAKKTANKKSIIKSVRGAIRRRYLVNCTFEMHDETLKVVLAKKIVRDKCPSCGAAIVGAVDENYKCKYCDSVIMNVICKV